MSTPAIHVGTNAGNGGAGLVRLHPGDDGVWATDTVFADARNASFAVRSRRHDLHYLVDERRDGGIGMFRLGVDGWHRVATVPSHGDEPCYVALNADESRLAVANYGSGSIALFRLDPATGLPSADPDIRRHAGHGPVADRQEGPHAHCACFSPDGRWLFHVDLGTDRILGFPLGDGTGPMGEGRVAFAAPPGSGPRHLVFHPTRPLALLASELANTLTVLHVDGGTLTPMTRLSTLPAGFAGHSIVGHLSLDRTGHRIYVTNRGHDSIAVFAWPDGEPPHLLQHVPGGGASPRAFTLIEAERLLVLANEQESNVTFFAIRADGTLAHHHASVDVPGAAFVFAETGGTPR